MRCSNAPRANIFQLLAKFHHFQWVVPFKDFGIKTRKLIECLEGEKQDSDGGENERELDEDMNMIIEVLLPEDPAISDEILFSTHTLCILYVQLTLVKIQQQQKTKKIHHSTMGKNAQLYGILPAGRNRLKL